MKQAIAKKSFSPASLRQPRSARTLLLRMAADQERAERVRALKQSRPDLTWRRIGDYVGVSERAAIDWQKNGGIDYANAEKLAALFEVDVDYIWRGTESTTPDLFAGNGSGSTEDRLARIEEAVQGTYQLLQQASDARHAQQEEILARIEALEKAMIHNGDQVADRAVEQVRDLVRQPDEVVLAIEALASELHADADRQEAANEAEATRSTAERGRRATPRRSARAAK